MKNSHQNLNPYKIKWYFVVRFRKNKRQSVKVPKYLLKGTGISTSKFDDVIFTHSKKDALRIFENFKEHNTKRLLSFIITDKQFGLINSAKAKKIFSMMLPTSFGLIPITQKQQAGDWLNPATNLL